MSNQHLVLNGIFHASVPDDPVAAAMERRCQDALSALPETLASFPRTELALAPQNLVGVAALRAFLQSEIGQRKTSRIRHTPQRHVCRHP